MNIHLLLIEGDQYFYQLLEIKLVLLIMLNFIKKAKLC